MLTGGVGVRAMSLAFEDVFGIPNAFADLQPAGRTDAWLLGHALELHGVAAARPEVSRFSEAYAMHLARELARPGPRKGIMPGIQQLLSALVSRGDAFLALLTGNTETGARLKLEYFDLWRFFRCGAFGEVSLDRHALFSTAIARVRECGGLDVPVSQVVVIGDTPLDVAAAAAGGARSLAVATGSYGVEALTTAGADVVFETLADTSAVLDEIDRLTASRKSSRRT